MMTDKKSRPFVVCHMLCSIYGKIEGNFMSAPESASCIKKYGDLRSTFGCEAVLYGTRTAAESFASGRVSDFQDKRMRLTAKDFVAENDADDYIVAIDADGILSKLKALFSIERLMLAGGGITNGSFLEKDLIDELSVVTVPVVEGERSSASLFENVFMSGGGGNKAFSLEKAERLGDNGLWIRYIRVKDASGTGGDRR